MDSAVFITYAVLLVICLYHANQYNDNTPNRFRFGLIGVMIGAMSIAMCVLYLKLPWQVLLSLLIFGGGISLWAIFERRKV